MGGKGDDIQNNICCTSSTVILSYPEQEVFFKSQIVILIYGRLGNNTSSV